MAETPDADRILVIRLGALGDVVRTLPAVSSLRALYPGALISWLVEPAAAGVLEGQPLVDEVLIFPRSRMEGHLRAFRPIGLLRELAGFVRLLRDARFDLVLDFHGILKSGVLARLSGAPLRIGYAPPVGREQAWRFANRRVRLAPGKLSRFDRNAALVRYLGGASDPPHGAGLRLAPCAASRAQARRAEARVVIHPGTSSATVYKRYTAEGYAEVVRALHERAGLVSVVSHGAAAGELEFAERVVNASQGAARLAPTTPSFADLAELLASAAVFIGSDSGPLHAASLLGTPVVQLLGPTDPVENEPYRGTPARSLRVPVACSPCRRGCAAATCMRLIPPQRVVEATLELLREAGEDGTRTEPVASVSRARLSSPTDAVSSPSSSPSNGAVTRSTAR